VVFENYAQEKCIVYAWVVCRRDPEGAPPVGRPPPMRVKAIMSWTGQVLNDPIRIALYTAKM
jgi:hypothetical protein